MNKVPPPQPTAPLVAAESVEPPTHAVTGAERDGDARADAALDAVEAPSGTTEFRAVAPDLLEQEWRDELDNIVPTRGYRMLPMVGLGGSAGSIGALHKFFESMPADSGMVFVVILHLAPDHESTLAALLQRVTKMPVRQAEDAVQVAPNHVYVIPPGKHLVSVDGHLRLTPYQDERGRRVAVDLFFRTLADTHGPHSAAIVLSGADGDGALGLKRIKERGGLTIAQDPNEAEHSSMPRAAIATGMVDWILPVAEMPRRLVQYHAHEQRLEVPPEEGPHPAQPLPAAEDQAEKALRAVLSLLHARTGRDFSCYKRATILRRTARRLQVNGLADLPSYLDFLQTHPGEAGALLQDLLVSVTNFFRDRDSFAALEMIVPLLFVGKGPNDAVRAWVPACATGDEAYSIAILLWEHARKLEAPPFIQVFATDLDEAVIRTAREGVFPAAITADVSEERLRRFFVPEPRGFRVRREVREVVLFAQHDLLQDSPFSRLDLISCRNLLIYLDRTAQARAFETFHFSLLPQGRLFLGSSETIEEGSALFSVVDKAHRLYAPRPTGRLTVPMPIGSSTLARALEAHARSKTGPIIPRLTSAGGLPGSNLATARPEAVDGPAGSWKELHFQLLAQHAPPSLLVNPQREIVYVSETAGRFLRFAGGEPTQDLLQTVHPQLRLELRAALYRAAASGAADRSAEVALDLEGARWGVAVRVAPADEVAPDFLLILFEARPLASDEQEARSTANASDPVIAQLEKEIEQARRQLREVIEQFDSRTEELKSGNEELQATNEELCSATEELETSREELQSINEELTTVNQELKSRVDELGHANSDLANLMSATSIATIFLDRDLRITRYTPAAVALFRLIVSDVGRPLSDLAHQLTYPELAADAERVLATLIPIKREVPDATGRWFFAQLVPYRTGDDHIAGAVLTLVDITEQKNADFRRMELASEMERQSRIFHTTLSSIADFAYTFDRQGRFIYANQPLLKLLGRTLEEVAGHTFDELGYEAELAARLNAQVQHVFTTRESVVDDTPFTSAEGKTGFYEYIFQPVVGADGAVEVVAGSTRDITERKRMEAELRAGEEKLRLMIENVREYALFSVDLARLVTSWNPGAERLLGYSAGEILGRSADIIFTAEDRANGACEEEARMAVAEGRAADERWHMRKDGSRFWGSGVMMAMHNATGQVVGMVKIFRDQTQERQAKEALEKGRIELWDALQETERARAEAEAAGQAKDQFLAVLSHELRTPLTPILVAVQTLNRRRDLPPPVVEALSMIRRNVEIEAHFIDDLLDLTRVARGTLEIVREEVDLHQAIRHAIEISQGDLEAKQQRLNVSLEATRVRLSGDIARLQQVFWNLLKNASKFTPVAGAVMIRTRDEGDFILIEVTDNGIGLAPEHAGNIFHPFQQATASISQEFGGLGLGLAIVRATVLAHEGTIAVQSEGVGRGATFEVRLPLDAASGANLRCD